MRPLPFTCCRMVNALRRLTHGLPRRPLWDRGALKWRSVAALAICASVVCCGSAGKAQKPIPEQPVMFVDGVSGEMIPRVLVIPKYGSSTGVASGGGHGPGYMFENAFLAFPFVYEPGLLFRVPQPDSRGIRLGDVFFAGRGLTVEGVVLLAPGYAPRFFWELWDRQNYMKVSLDRRADNEGAARERLRFLLAQDRIRGAELSSDEREAFSMAPDSEAVLRFSEPDRTLIGRFFASLLRSSQDWASAVGQ